MTDLLDPTGYAAPVSGTYGGSYLVIFGGGGARPLSPSESDQSQFEPIQHRAIVPMVLASLDANTMEHAVTNLSYGEARQPVSGGQAAPWGIIQPNQVDIEYVGGQTGQVRQPA
jgi:hypothetical protein